ncbi:MAG TPA: TadE/TadG family type IV pilus assembly protein [Abditibacterium sp.]|jgi:Flp pilus assembly protein TadG
MLSLQTSGQKRQRLRRERRRAFAIVEFALILPILLAILLGIIEFGWMAKSNLTLANATREGVRTASLGAATADISNRITTSASPLLLASPNGSILMQYSTNGGTNYLDWPADVNGKNSVPVGSLIRITSTTVHRPLTGFFSFLRNRNLQSLVTMRREM